MSDDRTAHTVPAYPSILRDDLAAAMPGCDIYVTSFRTGGYTARAIHRTTGRHLVAHIDDDGYRIYYGAGASHTGRSAYGFDSAISHAYRHHLDFGAEHGPGTAWDYRDKDLVPAS